MNIIIANISPYIYYPKNKNIPAAHITAGIKSLKYCVLDYKEYCKHIHKGLDLLGISCADVDNNIGNNADADTIGNAVNKRHDQEGKESRNAFCRILEIDSGNGTHHKEADKYMSESWGKDGEANNQS